MQVKYTEAKGEVIEVRPTSMSLTNGRVRRIKKYTAQTIDWLAFFNATTDRCYYLHASELGNGRRHLNFRLGQPRNNQVKRIRYTRDFEDPVLPQQPKPMEPAGFEPATFRMQTERSPN
ncbi:MAG: hypothetical protein QOI10_929 [Solirubrobacterales bacterium]|nr:hypothetical protein [Solirubrobacterales bacterium]